MNSSAQKAIIGPMRLPFLILTPACVAVGVATAKCALGVVDWLDVALIMAGALAAHISVNAFNEYDDFKTGLDFTTTRTPFSGGSGALPQVPEKAIYTLILGVVPLILTSGVGVYFMFVHGLGILPIGIAGLITVVAYTKVLTKRPILCLFAPGLGFGPLMVMGTHFALTGEYSVTAFVASLVPFFLVSDLLLLNQFPDVEADRKIGRNHLPILIGLKKSAVLYALILVAAYFTLIIGWAAGYLPVQALFALVTAVLAISAARGAARHFDDIDKLIPSLAKNVMINIATPFTLALGIYFGSC